MWARYLFDESARESQEAHMSAQASLHASKDTQDPEAKAQGTEGAGMEKGGVEGSRRAEQVDPVLPSHAPVNENVVDELVEAGRWPSVSLHIHIRILHFFYFMCTPARSEIVRVKPESSESNVPVSSPP